MYMHEFTYIKYTHMHVFNQKKKITKQYLYVCVCVWLQYKQNALMWTPGLFEVLTPKSKVPKDTSLKV